MLTLEGPPRETSSANSAALRQRTYNVISDTELRDIGTHSNHNSGNLVAEYRGRGDNIVSGKQHVGVAQARCLHVDEDFASYWRGDLNLLEIEFSTEFIEYERLHLRPPHSRTRIDLAFKSGWDGNRGRSP